MADDTSTTTPTPAVIPQAVEQKEFPLMLDEFCTQLSAVDRRVETIGAFHSVEKAAGHNKDTASAFAARYAAFLNKPM